MTSFMGFIKPKSDGGKTNFGNATPSNVDNGVLFSSANYINAIGTSTKKNWQTGTVTSSSATSSFVWADASGTAGVISVSVTVSGLTFTPSIIILTYKSSSPRPSFTMYNAAGITNIGGTNMGKIAKVVYDTSGYTSSSSTTVCFRLAGAAYVNATGFLLPVDGASTLYDWIAIE